MTAGSQNLDLLGLFPSFESRFFGGIQASGREAWHAISERTGLNAGAFYYDPSTSRSAALLRAARSRRRAETLFVWHLGLLKLKPFVASNRRTVVFLHGVEAWKRLDLFTAWLLRRTDLFLSNSNHTWERFCSHNPGLAAAAHRTVALGIGNPLESATPRPADTPAALMIGRLSRDENYKGHRELINIWPRVIERMPEAELWIAGDGDLRPELESRAAQLSVGDRVRFFGAIPEAQKEELLRRSRALLLPSAGEGFGLVYLEAMRMGRPCLVSGTDAGIEVVSPPEAGFAANPADTGCLMESVLRLLTPGAEWDQMSRAARTRYETRFTAGHFRSRLQNALFG